MSTPLKALIQERLKAKIVRREPDYNYVDDDYQCGSDRSRRHSAEIAVYDVSSRDGDIMMTSSSRLTHIDPSAYLVPSPHSDPYYPHAHGGRSPENHNRHRHSGHSHEQYCTHDVRHDQHHLHHRRHHHDHSRERQPRYEPSYREGYRDSSYGRRPVSPWRLSDYVSTSRSAPMSRGYREHPPEKFHKEYMRGQYDVRGVLPSPEYTKSTFHQSNHHSNVHYRERYGWGDRAYDYNQSVPVVRGPSSTHHGRGEDCHASVKSAGYSNSHSHSNQNRDSDKHSEEILPASPTRHQPDATSPEQKIDETRRQIPPSLDMGVVDPAARVTGKTRTWTAILSPESRLAAKAFVEKRRRRTDKSTPRTRATQRWLEAMEATNEWDEALVD